VKFCLAAITADLPDAGCRRLVYTANCTPEKSTELEYHEPQRQATKLAAYKHPCGRLNGDQGSLDKDCLPVIWVSIQDKNWSLRKDWTAAWALPEPHYQNLSAFSSPDAGRVRADPAHA
jgi:hypothetical protein